MAETKIHAREIIGSIERSIARLPHSAKYARAAELERDAINLRAGVQFLKWADDHRTAIAAALAAEKETSP